MTDRTTTLDLTSTSVLPAAALAAFIGIVLVAIAGHSQAEALHTAAHDVRHATGFPCH